MRLTTVDHNTKKTYSPSRAPSVHFIRLGMLAKCNNINNTHKNPNEGSKTPKGILLSVNSTNAFIIRSKAAGDGIEP